jgi:hypothetical protein
MIVLVAMITLIQFSANPAPHCYQEAIDEIVKKFNRHQIDEIKKAPVKIAQYNIPSFVESKWLNNDDELYNQFKKEGIHDKMLISLFIARGVQLRILGKTIDYKSELDKLRKKQAEIETVLQHPPANE